ncbi:energy-coupling factor transporter ATPase [Salipaludibacillus sp. HK11]|uniref:energy-coupling factor transporter ATPase n=1 Tax=Salipaludibacillus sp. HK11 TaxID=3394320 RepID=UPI0039FC2C23
MANEITVDNLFFRYHEQSPYVLNDISLTVKQGEWLTILGHNGSGKSTLAKFFNALNVPSKGDVVACGINTKTADEWINIRRNVAMVFQNPDNQIVAPTVEDDVAFGLENAGVPYEDMRDRVYNSINKLGLSGLEKQEPHRLSGGQKQRVALAGALALRPRVLVLDEATSMLDPTGRKEVLSILEKLRVEENISIIMITHDVTEALLSDRIIILAEGSIVHEGVPNQIFTDEASLGKVGLRAPFIVQIANELRRHDVPLPEGVLSHEELVSSLCKYKPIA